MSRTDKLSSYCTTIAANNGTTQITYHSTVIVQFDADRVVLRTGGWKSVTTKRKMNQAARQFGLNYSVYQKNHGWFVHFTRNGADVYANFDDSEIEIPREAA